MEKSIFIAFTNYDKITDLNYKENELTEIFNGNLLGIENGNKFLTINENGIRAFSNDITNLDELIAIICYDYNENNNNEYIEEIHKIFLHFLDNDYIVKVLHHENQNQELIGLINKFKDANAKFIAKKGIHVNGNIPYEGVIDILLESKPKDDNQNNQPQYDNSFKKIIQEKTFFFEKAYKLEITLDFLLDYLNNQTFPSIPEEWREVKVIKAKYDEWKNSPDDEKLKTFRDIVLEWANAEKYPE